jgi:hypothetical protein
LQLRKRVGPVGISYRPSECADRVRECISVRKARQVFTNLGVVETEQEFGMRQRLVKRARGQV